MSTEDVHPATSATLNNDPWTLASHICIRPKIDASGIIVSAKPAAQEVALARILQYVIEHMNYGSPEAAAVDC
jgi:hypothetical protein